MALAAANLVMVRHPLGTAMGVTSGKACLADVMTQTLIEGTPLDEINGRRALLFASFGLCYQGCFQYWMYNKLYEGILFPGNSARAIASKVLASNFISDPVFFFPTFYTFREVINRGAFRPSCFTDGLANYAANYRTDWVNSKFSGSACCCQHLSLLCLVVFSRQ